MTYGCHNHMPFKTSMVVQNGWYHVNFRGVATRIPKLVEMPWRGTPECMYTTSEAGKTDPQCDGCYWKRNPIIGDNR